MPRAPRACVASGYTVNACCAYTALVAGLQERERNQLEDVVAAVAERDPSAATFKRCASAAFSAKPLRIGIARQIGRSPSAMARLRTSGMPRGFSLLASLTIVAGSSPSSRATSSIGLPGTYGRCRGRARSDIAGQWLQLSAAFIALCRSLGRIRARGASGRAPPVCSSASAARPPARRLVSGEVDEEQVLPEAGARRPRLEARHRHAVRAQRHEQVQHARPACWAPTSRASLVATRRRGDAAGGRAPRSASCCWARPRCAARRSRGRRWRAAFSPAIAAASRPRARAAPLRRCSRPAARHAGQCWFEPARTAQAIARANTRAHAASSHCLRKQVLLDCAACHLAADREVVSSNKVERASDRAFGRILDRHDRVVGLPALDRAEHVVDRRARHRVDEAAEMLAPPCRLNVPRARG